MDPDPGGTKTYGSGSTTLHISTYKIGFTRQQFIKIRGIHSVAGYD